MLLSERIGAMMNFMNNTHSFKCIECFDTQVIDRSGAEVTCPYCPVTIKLTGLTHGFPAVEKYSTIASYTSTTVTFTGTRGEILRDAAIVRQQACTAARLQGLKGRNHVSSSAISVEGRVQRALGA